MLSALPVPAVVTRVLSCRRGVTAIEYGLIAAVTVTVVAAAIGPIHSAVVQLYATVMEAFG